MTQTRQPQLQTSRPTLRYPVDITLQIAIQGSNTLLEPSPQPAEETTDLLMEYRRVTRLMTLGTTILILMSTHIHCMVSLSVFAGPARILRRFSVFAEEPHKSNITTTEPCNPVFKEAQPRPFKQSVSLVLASLIRIYMQFTCCIKCSFTVNYCNKASNRIVSKTKGFSVFFWIILSHEVSRYFPIHTRTSTYLNFENLLYIRGTPTNIPLSLVENLMSRGRRNKSWIVSSRLHTAIFQNIRKNRAPYRAN